MHKLYNKLDWKLFTLCINVNTSLHVHLHILIQPQSQKCSYARELSQKEVIRKHPLTFKCLLVKNIRSFCNTASAHSQWVCAISSLSVGVHRIVTLSGCVPYRHSQWVCTLSSLSVGVYSIVTLSGCVLYRHSQWVCTLSSLSVGGVYTKSPPTMDGVSD